MQDTLLVTIDFINELTHEDGKLAHSVPFIEQYHTIDNANKMIQWARKQSILIAHVKVGFSKNYIECPENSPIFTKAKEFGALQLDTWGCKFNEALAISADDKIIVKHRISAFYNTDLETILKAQSIKTIILCGVATHMAVELTAREAHDRDYSVIVVKDACATANETIHNNALENIARIATVKNSAEFQCPNEN